MQTVFLHSISLRGIIPVQSHFADELLKGLQLGFACAGIANQNNNRPHARWGQANRPSRKNWQARLLQKPT